MIKTLQGEVRKLEERVRQVQIENDVYIAGITEGFRIASINGSRHSGSSRGSMVDEVGVHYYAKDNVRAPGPAQWRMEHESAFRPVTTCSSVPLLDIEETASVSRRRAE